MLGPPSSSPQPFVGRDRDLPVSGGETETCMNDLLKATQPVVVELAFEPDPWPRIWVGVSCSQ